MTAIRRWQPLIQEGLLRGPLYGWRMLVACILLNRACGRSVSNVLEKTLHQWHSPYHLARASRVRVNSIVYSLGLMDHRAGHLIGMSEAWMDGKRPPKDKMPGVGRYAVDSWRVFVLGRKQIRMDADRRLKDYMIRKRFWAKVSKERCGGCWIWEAHVEGNGYGRFWLDGSLRLAHRIAYEMVEGEIGSGMELDHLCQVKACVNPDHLEPVDHVENCRRREAGGEESYSGRNTPA